MKARPHWAGCVVPRLLQNLCESEAASASDTPNPLLPPRHFLLRARTAPHSQQTQGLLCLLGACDFGLGSVFSSVNKKDFTASILGPFSYLPRSP